MPVCTLASTRRSPAGDDSVSRSLLIRVLDFGVTSSSKITIDRRMSIAKLSRKGDKNVTMISISGLYTFDFVEILNLATVVYGGF